jgi:hypothetical protein
MMLPDQTLLDVIRRQRLAAGMLVAIVLLAGVNWILSPEQALRWFMAMLSLPLLCLGLSLWYVWKRRSSSAADADDQLAMQRYFHAVLTMIVLAVGIRQIASFGLEIWVRFGDHHADLEFERRILGLATSAMYVIAGNALPKILTPLSMLPLHLAERVTSARRFIGTTLVILGLVLAVAFLLLPLEFAKSLERWTIIGSLLTILGAIVWMNAGPARHEQ